MPEVSVRTLFRIIQTIEAWLLSAAMILIAVFTILNVFSRVLFNTSLAFTEEVSQFLIILVTFVGLSYGASQGRHIRMTAIYDQFNARNRKRLMILIAGSTALLLFYLAYYSFHYVYIVYALGSVSPALQVPLFLVYLAAPLGLILAGIQYLFTVIRNIRQPDVYLSYEKKDKYEEETVGGGM